MRGIKTLREQQVEADNLYDSLAIPVLYCFLISCFNWIELECNLSD